jgi:hypothetical protein
MSMNRLALTLNCNRKTIPRRLEKLGKLSALFNTHVLQVRSHAQVSCPQMYFDEMRSFVHTRYKPVSIPLVVGGDRRIWGVDVASIPPFGVTAKAAIAKYGKREDLRQEAVLSVLSRVRSIVNEETVFRSDEAPDYPNLLQEALPFTPKHETFKGRRGAGVGYGELKIGEDDPLFALNHTAAMVRANVSRLLRKTWNTTKRQDRLKLHLELYAYVHNEVLVPIKEKRIKRQHAFQLALKKLLRHGCEELRQQHLSALMAPAAA